MRSSKRSTKRPTRRLGHGSGLAGLVRGWVGFGAMSRADRFKPYAPDVRAVVRLDEALPADHPVHVFIDLVRSIDLSHFVIPPGPKGEKPYHPHALFGILAWGYLHGVRSSRKLARAGPPGGHVRVPGRGRATRLPDAGAVPAGQCGRVHGDLPGDGGAGAAPGAGAAGEDPGTAGAAGGRAASRTGLAGGRGPGDRGRGCASPATNRSQRGSSSSWPGPRSTRDPAS